MKLSDFLWLGMLMVGALLIWLGDLAWVSGASETLPVLIALPLFVWLGAPWRFRSGPFQLPGPSLAASFQPDRANLDADAGLARRIEAQRGNATRPVVVPANLEHVSVKLPVPSDRHAGAGRLGR